LVLVVVSLLVNLGSHIKEVRRASIQCLQALSGVTSQFHLVIDHLVPKAEEIISDTTYVVQVNSLVKKAESICVAARVCIPMRILE
jgi:hypothetical protein